MRPYRFTTKTRAFGIARRELDRGDKALTIAKLVVVIIVRDGALSIAFAILLSRMRKPLKNVSTLIT